MEKKTSAQKIIDTLFKLYKKNYPNYFYEKCTQFVTIFFYFMVRKFVKTFGGWPWLGV